MKLRNFVYAAMIACTFASCSKDDENVPTPGSEDATLDVKILAPASTKATGAVTGKTDETITTLNVYVFDATDKLEKTGVLKAGSTTESEPITISAGRKSVVVLANQAWAGSTLAELYAADKEFSGEVDGTLSMNSMTYTVDVVAGKKNHLGFGDTGTNTTDYFSPAAGVNPVYLYRNVAKVKLAAIELKNTNANKYPDAELKVEEVFILHGSQKTLLVGGAKAWNTTYVGGVATLGGYDAATYEAWTKINGLTDATKKQNYWTTFTGIKKENNYVSSFAAEEINQYGTINNVDSFYVYENTASGASDIKTLLVVKARLIYGDIASFDDVNSRYYSIAVGHQGLVGSIPTLNGITRTETGVLRNLQYNVTLGVSGPGYEGPFGPDVEGDGNTNLDVKVQVVKFGEVNQSQDIE